MVGHPVSQICFNLLPCLNWFMLCNLKGKAFSLLTSSTASSS